MTIGDIFNIDCFEVMQIDLMYSMRINGFVGSKNKQPSLKFPCNLAFLLKTAMKFVDIFLGT